MKSILLLAILFTSSVYGDDKAELLASAKNRIVQNIDQKISVFQTLKACVQAASSKDQLKSCRETHKVTMKGVREENKGERKAWREEVKAKKQEQRK